MKTWKKVKKFGDDLLYVAYTKEFPFSCPDSVVIGTTLSQVWSGWSRGDRTLYMDLHAAELCFTGTRRKTFAFQQSTKKHVIAFTYKYLLSLKVLWSLCLTCRNVRELRTDSFILGPVPSKNGTASDTSPTCFFFFSSVFVMRVDCSIAAPQSPLLGTD